MRQEFLREAGAAIERAHNWLRHAELAREIGRPWADCLDFARLCLTEATEYVAHAQRIDARAPIHSIQQRL